MKRNAVILICLAGGLVLSTISRGDATNTVQPGNPYGAIVKRNVFGLNPIPVVDPNAPPPGPPPPRITLTGITTLFGEPEALYKVSGVVRPGKPPQDESYIFVEGESQDDVEVSNIDVETKVVTFINHGIVQVIPLVAGVASTGDMPAQPRFGPGRFKRGFFGRPGGPPGNFQPYTPPAPNVQPNGNGSGYNQGNNNSAPGFGYNSSYNNGNVQNNTYTPSSISSLSEEDQAALIAAQRAQMEQQNSPLVPIMPPTQFDDQARKELGGGNSGNANPTTPPAP